MIFENIEDLKNLFDYHFQENADVIISIITVFQAFVLEFGSSKNINDIVWKVEQLNLI